MAKKAIIRVGSRVKFVDGNVPEIQPGGVDFKVVGKVVGLASGLFPFIVKLPSGNEWVAKREWLRKVATKKKRK